MILVELGRILRINDFDETLEILFMPKKCKNKSDKQRYGPFPLGNRVGVDQVPLELNQRDFTWLTTWLGKEGAKENF